MVSINVELDGLSQLLAKLKAIEPDADRVVMETITDLVTDTHAFAVSGIQGGPKSGRVYGSHTASAPGQYPASDTGRLASSVRMELPQVGNMTGRVGTAVTYGPMLEFGTSRMAARPWLFPSFQKAKIGIEKELRARLEARL